MIEFLETVKDIILYIPRRIHGHFEYIKELEDNMDKLEKDIHNRDLAFKRIVTVCTANNYGDSNGAYKLRKIKELAETFPNV